MPYLDLLLHEPDIRLFREGEAIFQEGDPASCMYAVVDGVVAIHLKGSVIERVEHGGIFGEMGLIDSRPRRAAAIAETECRLAVISEKRFLRLVEQMPQFALQVMRVLTRRIAAQGPQ